MIVFDCVVVNRQGLFILEGSLADPWLSTSTVENVIDKDRVLVSSHDPGNQMDRERLHSKDAMRCNEVQREKLFVLHFYRSYQ